MFGLIPLACVFLIFLDYHRRNDVHQSIIYVIAFFAVIFLLGIAVEVLKFNLLFFAFMVPFLLFSLLYWKNRKDDRVKPMN